MSWGQNKRKARNAAAAATLLVFASAAMADILVVRSIGPSAKNYPAGKRLSETGTVTLKASDMLVVLDGRGTRTLQGPGNFALNTAPQRVSGTRAQAPRLRIGATRGPERPSLWDIDISKSSTFCVAEPNNITLWREDPAKAVTVTLVRTKDNQSRKLNWTGGEAKTAWPTAWPIADGADYRLTRSGAAPIQLRFKILPQRPAGLENMASSLITNGCTAQLDLLIETVKVPEERPQG